MRGIMEHKEFEIAFKKADEVLAQLNYDGNDMVDTNEVIKIVEKLTNKKIKVFELDFTEIAGGDDEIADCGAMIRIDNDKPELAKIVLNTKRAAMFQRFSLVHELGHLITNNMSPVMDKYVMSTHIRYDLMSISDEVCEKDKFMLNEQVCNIFALLVLIPKKFFFKKIMEYNSLVELVKFFGVPKEAIVSRMRLGDK